MHKSDVDRGLGAARGAGVDSSTAGVGEPEAMVATAPVSGDALGTGAAGPGPAAGSSPAVECGAGVGHVGCARAHLSVARAGVAGMSVEQASAELAAVRGLIGQAEAYRVALVARMQECAHAVGGDGSGRDVSEVLKRDHLFDQGQVVADRRAGEVLAALPTLAQAADAGRVSRSVVDAIARTTAGSQRRRDAMPDAVATFVELAQTAPLSVVRKQLDMWADQVDPGPDVADENDAYRRREFTITQVRNGVKVAGFFPKTQAIRLMSALNGALDKRWRASHDPHGTGHSTVTVAARGAATVDGRAAIATSSHGGDPIVASTGAQRADAFIDGIITPVLEHGLVPSCGGAPATIAVTVPLDRLRHPHDGHAPADVTKGLVAGSLPLASANLRAPNGPGETLISPALAQELACDATIQRVIISPAGKPLDDEPESSPNTSAPRSPFATAAASSPTAIDPSVGHTPTTSTTGAKADQHHWTTWCWFARNTTTKSTPNTYPSPTTPTASQRSTSNTDTATASRGTLVGHHSHGSYVNRFSFRSRFCRSAYG